MDSSRVQDVGSKRTGIIEVEPDLQSGEPIGDGSSDNTDEGSGRNTDETSSRSDGDETTNGTGAEANDGPSVEMAPIEKHPSQASEASCKVGAGNGHACLQIGSECGTTIEAKPAEPAQEDLSVSLVETIQAPWRRTKEERFRGRRARRSGEHTAVCPFPILVFCQGTASTLGR